MKRWLALACVFCLLTGCACADDIWTREEWEAVVDALESDETEPVPESRRVAFRSSWLPAKEMGFVNMLLISSDAPDIEKNYGRASAILVCRINLLTGNMRLLSLPDDAMVKLAELPEAVPLRYVNCFGGAGLTARCVNDALGLRVSRFCAVNIEAFIEIVDALGGVVMELTEEEAQALDLEQGKQRLTGEQALQYVKMRLPGDGSRRVRGLLSAVLRQTLESGSVKQMLLLWDLLLPAVDTNVTTDDLLELVFGLFSVTASASVEALGVTAESGSLDETVKAQCRKFLYGEE